MHDINSLWKNNGIIYRILDIVDNEYLVIDCIRRCNPTFIKVNDLESAAAITEEQLRQDARITIRNNLNNQELAECNRRYTLIKDIINIIGSDTQRCEMLRTTAKLNGLSIRGVKKWLYKYVAFQDMRVFAHKEPPVLELTDDQKNFRWALNKYYYTRHGKNLSDTYISLIKEKYCDIEGKILPNRPTIYQFRYFFKKHRNIQTEYISRDGLKDYQMNHRPLLGDGVQQFAPNIGTGMLDSTICDIYLCDNQGNVVGRPVLTACVDAYSGLCCGYSLGWEGGMYSIRTLLTNVISDKIVLCRSFGIEITREQWPCQELPATLVTDKGSEYASMNFEQLAELGITIVNLPAFRPELKGRVEKLFDLIQTSYKPYLKGRGVIQTDFQKRGCHDYRRDACLTLRDFESIIIHSIIYHNNKRMLEKFPYTEEMLRLEVPPFPVNIWSYQHEHGKGNLIAVTSEMLIAVMLPRTTGKFTRKGLVVNRLRYACDGFAEEFLKGGKVIVAYNPDDVSHIYLVDQGFKRFELIESRFLGANLSQVEEAHQKQRELMDKYSETALQGRIDLVAHIQTIAEQRSIKPSKKLNSIRETRKIEQAENHIDLLKELNDGRL